MNKMYYVMLGMLLCLVVAALGCTSQQGSQNVQGVTAVVLNGPGTLIVQQGDNESFTMEGDTSKIDTRVSGNVLTISNLNVVSNEVVKYHLTVKDLNTITLHGLGEAQVTNLNTNKLTTTIDSGTITFAGKVNEHIATINGGGNINAQGLESQIATVTINGEGKATVKVVKTLNAIINGGGSISYLGNPQVNKQINGLGTVTRIS